MVNKTVFFTAIKKNKKLSIIIAIISFFFIGIIIFHCIKDILISRFFATYEPSPATISVVTVKKSYWQPSIAAVGNFVANHGVEITAQASGKINKIYFDSGQYVKLGTPLIDLDDSLEQATLQFNQAHLRLQEINYQRQADLYKHGMVAGSVLDIAKANLDQAKANINKIQAEIRYKHITAPFSGNLGIRQVNQGQTITAGQTSIVSLQALDPLYLHFYVPEQLHHHIYVGQQIQFKIEGFEKKIFSGKVTAINSQIDANIHNILVQATVANCPITALKDHATCDTQLNKLHHITKFLFIPGMFASITVKEPPIPNQLTIPTTAISSSLYGNSVFVIKKDKKIGKTHNGQEIFHVKKISVTTRASQGNYTIITQGLNLDQMVVSSGELKLRNGSSVVINNSVALHDTQDSNKLEP